MSSAASEENIAQFIELTGADEATAKSMLEAAKGDMDQAIALHYEPEGGASEASPAVAPTPEPPALPTESTTDLVGDILKNVRQEGEGSTASSWSGAGAGRTLGAGAGASEGAEISDAAAAAAEPLMADRTNAKKVRVIFWADGFTVEDVTAEEAAAAAAAKAPPAPRRTGLATLGSEAARSGAPPMPKLPELRKYEGA